MTEKSKMIHEEVYDKFNIDVNKHEYKSSKMLPREWYKEIMNFHINKIIDNNGEIDSINNNFSRINFENKEQADNFRRKFNEQFLKNLNYFIKNMKNENPKDYNRGVVTTINEDSPIVMIEY
ncbi:MAG: hypothetical protein ACOC22_04105 [bacterium]